MKAMLILAVFVLASLGAAAQIITLKDDLSVIGIGPSAIQESKFFVITAKVINYGPEPVKSFKIKWKVTNAGDADAKVTNVTTFDLPVALDKDEIATVRIDSLNLNKDGNYLVIAGVENADPSGLIVYEDVDDLNNWFLQQIGGKQTDVGVFMIDSPSPKNLDSGSLYVSVINYGPGKLESCYIRWLGQDAAQNDLYNKAVDTVASVYHDKWNKWRYSYHVFDPPLDSGKIRQIKADELTSIDGSDVLLACTYHPNGKDDFPGDDTSRFWMSPELWGKYSIGPGEEAQGSFNTINEAISYLYHKGMHELDKDNPVLGFAGVQFYARPGTYDGSIDLDGNFANQSADNSFSLLTFQRDSLDYVIKADGDNNYCLRMNNIQHFAVQGFTLDLQIAGNVVRTEDNVKDFEVGNCLLISPITNSTSPDFAVVKNTGTLDSCSFISSCFVNGSYGVYLTGQPGRFMSSAGASNNYFRNQKNCAISIQYADVPFASQNAIINNRIEFLDCSNPLAGENRVYQYADMPDKSGRGYSSEPYSLIGFLNCSGVVRSISNSLCSVNSDYYALHMKNCKNEDSEPSVINSSSLQSNKYGLIIEDSKNIILSQVSVDLTSGKSTERAGVYINSSTDNIQFINSIFHSSGKGYAVILDKGKSLVQEVRNDFFTSGDALARTDGKEFAFPGFEKWRDYLGFNKYDLSGSIDPHFYHSCDLIAQDPALQYKGYEFLKKFDAPVAIFPNEDWVNSQDVNFFWTEKDTSLTYWLQVSVSSVFPASIYVPDEMLDNEEDGLVYDQALIHQPGSAVFNLDYKTDYYWRVRVFDIGKRSDWSQIYHFRTGSDPNAVPENARQDRSAWLSKDFIGKATDRVYVNMTEPTGNMNIELYNYTSGRIGSRQITGADKTVEITDMFSGLNNGFYMVRISSLNKCYTYKMLIVR